MVSQVRSYILCMVCIADETLDVRLIPKIWIIIIRMRAAVDTRGPTLLSSVSTQVPFGKNMEFGVMLWYVCLFLSALQL